MILRDRIFLELLKKEGLKEPTREFTFHTDRQWRFDFAFLPEKIAVEVEGGNYKVTHYKDKKTGVMKTHYGGRHNTPEGMKADMEKYNQASLLGWKVYRFTPEDLHNRTTIQIIKQALNGGRNITYHEEEKLCLG